MLNDSASRIQVNHWASGFLLKLAQDLMRTSKDGYE